MSRRRPAVVAAALAVATVAASGGVAVGLWGTARVDTWGEVAFTEPLAVPPLAGSTVDPDGRRVFDLALRSGRHDFGAGVAADTWGVNGTYLGPTLRMTRGEDVAVRVRNGLPEPTTLHWHGAELPGSADGGPHQMVEPGGTWTPAWTVDQPAATLWYHPHPHGRTADHVRRGVAGFLLVDDPEAPSGLPSEYGVDDVPLAIQDRTFSRGEVRAGRDLLSSVGPLGDTVVVNGTVGPYLDVTTELVRLRLLNGSTARVYDLGFDDERAFALVGTDGGLLPEPREVDSVLLSPGERAEVVVAMDPGERVVLRSSPPELGASGFVEQLSGGADRMDVLELRAAERLAPSPPLPERLLAAEDLVALTDLADGAPSAVTRRFELAEDRVNGFAMDMRRIDESVPLGETERWEVTNTDFGPHNFHAHGVQFRVLETGGGADGGGASAGSPGLPPELAGWQDTVLVRPGETHRLAVRFRYAADDGAPYMLHCHLLRHEDAGMMAQIVVDDGAPAAGVGLVGDGEPASVSGAAGAHEGHGGHAGHGLRRGTAGAALGRCSRLC